MNTEQLKQLKQGDEIFIRARYKKIDADGDVRFSISVTSVFGGEAKGEGHTLPENVILPPPAPKYDPCRLFKKGDKVRVVEWNGRKLKTFDMSDVWEVACGETPGDLAVSLYRKCAKNWENCHVSQCYLELVTPVEELEPFSVCQDAEMECFEVYKCEYNEDVEGNEKVWKIVRTTYFYGDNQGLRTLAEAKAAAEAECARLNAAHRKEQA